MNKFYGFSLAEILITLVILGFVGALGVPMIGQQKLKKPVEIISRHGTLECFYDTDGTLHQYRANNTDNKNGIDETSADGACYFSAPSASLFVIQAVGAGGDGAVGTQSPKYSSQPVNVNDKIRTNQAFYADIHNKDKVPDWVRKEWYKQWKSDGSNWIQYKLVSPLGSSGKAQCEPRRKEGAYFLEKSCVEFCKVDILLNCPIECRDDLEAKGGDSGIGATYTVKAKIDVEDEISLTSNTDESTLVIGAKSITLKPSGNGKDAKMNYPSFGVATDGEKGENFVTSMGNGSYVSFSGGDIKILSAVLDGRTQLGGTGCSNMQGSPRAAGSVTGGTPAEIEFRTQSLGVNATFGLAGGAGDYKIKIMEKMPENTRLKLVPARDSSQTSIVYIEDSGEWKKFLEVSSGSDGIMKSEVIPIEEGDLPFPRKYYPAAFEGDAPEFQISSGAGYKSMMAKGGFRPGASGTGAYPVIMHVTCSAQHYIQNVPTGNETLAPLDGVMESVTCLDGSTPNADGYCGSLNTQGNPGAVVVSW